MTKRTFITTTILLVLAVTAWDIYRAFADLFANAEHRGAVLLLDALMLCVLRDELVREGQ